MRIATSETNVDVVEVGACEVEVRIRTTTAAFALAQVVISRMDVGDGVSEIQR